MLSTSTFDVQKPRASKNSNQLIANGLFSRTVVVDLNDRNGGIAAGRTGMIVDRVTIVRRSP